MAPKLDVDPNSGQRAQFGMRRSVGLGLLLLTACGGGIKAPETILVPPVASVPLTPVDTAPAEGTPASPAAAGTRGARIAPASPLGLRGKPVTGEHALVVTPHPLAGDVGGGILRRAGKAGVATLPHRLPPPRV